ncbi:hypothetical protein Anapl_04799 [Anas platyrhynchos]|uniref:Uncharacterized protein n=1 Tax=Anas platyrhynchos TaxID=8839 RepID=R0LHQ7_ANAPL|nr:hypothetical protein Anapl_04799 [Anas platyrhynchos]
MRLLCVKAPSAGPAGHGTHPPYQSCPQGWRRSRLPVTHRDMSLYSSYQHVVACSRVASSMQEMEDLLCESLPYGQGDEPLVSDLPKWIIFALQCFTIPTQNDVLHKHRCRRYLPKPLDKVFKVTGCDPDRSPHQTHAPAPSDMLQEEEENNNKLKKRLGEHTCFQDDAAEQIPDCTHAPWLTGPRVVLSWCESTGYWERAGLKLMQPKRVLLPLMAPNAVRAPTEERATCGRRTKPCHGEELKRGLGAAAPSLRPHELAGEPAGPHRRGAAALCEAQGEASAPAGQQLAGTFKYPHRANRALEQGEGHGTASQAHTMWPQREDKALPEPQQVGRDGVVIHAAFPPHLYSQLQRNHLGMSSKVIEISSIINNSGCTKIQAFRLKPDRFQGRFELQHQLHNLGCRVDPKPRVAADLAEQQGGKGQASRYRPGAKGLNLPNPTGCTTDRRSNPIICLKYFHPEIDSQGGKILLEKITFCKLQVTANKDLKWDASYIPMTGNHHIAFAHYEYE